MNVKTLLKSIIGTVAIYGVLFVSLFILRAFYKVLAVYVIICVMFAVFSFAAALLFKRQMNAWVWTVGTAIFFVLAYLIFSSPSGWDFEFFMLVVWLTLAPLLIPFFVVKGISRSWNNTN